MKNGGKLTYFLKNNNPVVKVIALQLLKRRLTILYKYCQPSHYHTQISYYLLILSWL